MKLPRWFDALFVALLVIYILAGKSATPFHGDESTLIYMSRDYAYQFLQGDLEQVIYHNPPISPAEQELRLLNGTVSKYLYGLAWHLGGFTVDDLNEQWDWGGDWNYNQSTGHAPSDALLQISRIPSALMLAVGAVIIFVLGNKLGGRPVAYLTSLYFALNPTLLLNGRRAMMEGSTIAFSLLAVLAGVWLLEKRRWWTALLLGVAAGAALASKHSAAFTLAAVFGACALYPFIAWIVERFRRRISPFSAVLRVYLLLGIAGLVALGVFYALNPAWWGDPITRVGEVLDMRTRLLTAQTADFGGYTDLTDALAGFFQQVFINQPLYYEVPAWSAYIAEPIARYEASPWHGVSLGGSIIGAGLLMALTLIGLYGVARAQSASGAVRWLIGLWALAMLVSTALFTPLEWQRYYIPAYPAVGLLASFAIVWLTGHYRLATELES